MEGYRPVEVKVWGELACFTRPEMKVERVSYPVMTPSAARGVLEAVYWKPQFRWLVREIVVLREPAFISILRNEVNSRASERRARSQIEHGAGYYAEEDRAQRHTLALRDVAYVIRADVGVGPGVTESPAKFRDQFRRRVKRGQSFAQPYLGCREFAAWFGEPLGDEKPIDRTEELGSMLFDIDYAAGEQGRGTPLFFSARMASGVLRVPAELYGG